MTDDTRKDAAAVMSRAEHALLAAEALLGLGLSGDAASRVYYAAFHAARALLFSIGVEPTTHESVKSLLSLHFIKAGKLPSERSKDLAFLESLRLQGDYEPHFAMSVQDLEPELQRARRFVADIKALLP